MDDTINRQDAINVIRHIKFKTRIECFDGIKLHLDAIQEFLRRFLDEQERVLKALPSAQPEDKCSECDAWNQYKNYPRQRWIPVTERLPNSQEEVIVSVCDETGDTKYNYAAHGWLTTDKEYWIVDNEINNYVVAWKPFPEPYREVENDG